MLGTFDDDDTSFLPVFPAMPATVVHYIHLEACDRIEVDIVEERSK